MGRDVQRTEVRLSALEGKKAVVSFYPKDGSPGCTKEVCAFRDNWK
jgi:peroxiredoxin Q/BCP